MNIFVKYHNKFLTIKVTENNFCGMHKIFVSFEEVII